MSPVELVVDGSRVTEQALTFPDQARGLAITSPETYERAADFLKGIKALREEIADTFDPHIERANKAHKALLADKRKADEPLVTAERIVKDSMVAWDREQERLRREEEQRLREQARREEEDRRLAEAIEMEESGREFGDETLIAAAEELFAAPVMVPAVAAAPTMPKVSGISYRETWSARVTNLAALIQHVAKNPSLANLLTANMTALNAQARSLKGNLAIPGVEAVSTRDVAAGRR